MPLPAPEDVVELMRRRRTARAHAREAVGDDTLTLLLEAVRWAPSAANRQPWELVVVRDDAVKRELRAAFLADAATHDPHYRTVTERQADLLLAPLVIGVCADERTKASFVDADAIGDAVQEELLLLTMGAAIQNLLLAATACGLTSTWIARAARVPSVRELLGLPAHVRPVAFVALAAGAPDEPREEHARRAIVANTHRDRYAAGA